MTWLTGWSNRMELAVDGSKIDGNLIDFPMLIVLSSGTGITNIDATRVFDNLVNNSKKIAITTMSGSEEVQCYAEIENWDAATEQAYIWTSVPALSSGTNTVIYFYYDAMHVDNTSYIGITGDVIARNVWDSNFKLVCHLNDNFIDSTVNGNNGTDVGSNDAVGLVASARSFPDTADNITFTTTNYGSSTTYTIETTVNPTSETAKHLWEGTAASAPSVEASSVDLSYYVEVTGTFPSISTGDLGTGNFRYLAAAYNQATTTQRLYVDGLQVGSNSANANDTFGAVFNLGNRGGGIRNYGGTVDELRISIVERSPAWIKATQYSLFDNLLTYSLFNGYFEGYVYEQSSPVAGRIVRAYNRDSGSLMGYTTSSGNGFYHLDTTYSGAHYVVALDDATGVVYNLARLDNVIPIEVI